MAVKLLLSLAACLVLAGCAEPLRWAWPSEAQRLAAGRYAQPEPAAYAPRSCYRTLGVVDCHAEPLPGAEGRRVGHFDAPLEAE